MLLIIHSMDSYFDLGARLGLALLVVLAIALLRVRSRLARFEPLIYGLAGLAGAAAFLNFGVDNHSWNRGFVNRWDQFHLQLGSKYFPELGYDGLYAASLLAQEQTAPEFPLPNRVRDLVTYKLVAPADLSAKPAAVRARFSDARWQSFLADHGDYLENTPPHLWRAMRRDHGYNATPAWTFVARLFGAWLPVTNATLVALGALDLLLVGAMFALLFRTYGYRAACLSLAIFGLGYGWRDIYIGSLLRLDWLAAAVIGICLLKRERFAAAGACIGYAAMVRVFPVLFLAGPALLALKALLRGERPRWPLRLAAGFGAVVCLAFAAGSLTGRGIEAWKEFGSHISVYRDTWSADLIGVDTLFLGGPADLFANLRGPAERRPLQGVRHELAEQRAARIAAIGALLGLVGLAIWRAPLAEAAVLGVVPFFALTPAAAYYWIVALVVPLRRGRAAALALLLLAAALHGIEMLYPSPDRPQWRFGLLAWGYALILIAWLIPDLARAIGQMRARWRGCPMSLPGLAPCLLVLLRVLSIASGSEGIVSASEVLIPAVAAVLAVLVAFFGASWLLGDRHCASALLCLWLLVLVVAPPLADWIAEAGASAPLDLVLALAALTLPASVATWALLRGRGGLVLLTLPLNAAAGAALLLPLASLALDAIRPAGLPLDDAGARVASSRSNPVADGARPDIYYIVLDGYGREDVLRAYYGHDNASFVRFLEDRGFYVAERSAANYAQTYLSLASSLNFSYLHLLSEELGAESSDRKPLMRLIAQSRLVGSLRERGYRLVAFATGYTGTEMPDADVYLEPEGSVSELDRTLAEAALLSRLVKKRPWYESHRARVLFTFDRLGDLADIEGPRFVFAHVLVPHPPFVFTPDGSRRIPPRRFGLYDGDAFMVKGTEAEYLEGYRQQVAFVNAELQRAVTRILQATPDAVILIQGDHGPGSRYYLSDADQTDFVERFAILSAYRLPGVVEGVLDPEISPVNAFRVVLDHLFGTELGRLEDRSFYSTWERPYQALDVTAEVRAWHEEPR